MNEYQREEREEELSILMEKAQERMADKCECDECGAKLPAIFDDGKLKIDCLHLCDIAEQTAAKARTSEIGKYVIATMNAINRAYLEGMKK